MISTVLRAIWPVNPYRQFVTRSLKKQRAYGPSRTSYTRSRMLCEQRTTPEFFQR